MNARRSATRRRSSSRAPLCACALLLGVCTTDAIAQPDAGARDLERGLRLLAEARYQQAIEHLERANGVAGGSSGPALIGLARAHNDLGDSEQALALAQRALDVVDDPGGRALAAAEAALALAAGAAPVELGFDEALAMVRRVLAERDRSPLTDGLRIRLCTARARLDDDSPFSLAVIPVDPPRLLAPESGIRKPTKLYSPPPDTGVVRQRETMRATEVATVRAVIDVDGCVVAPRVEGAAHPEWASEVLETASFWAFDPARLGGVPVPVLFDLTFTFQRR
ncbi:MAG TPA: tetratricopeptide repeat protein [Thermoanaerobaculia bacterium]|nr:tetratricopeptide repeat protein [Thermoanaerobaculia bacterium]